MVDRIEKVNELIKQQISIEIQKYFPDQIIAVTAADTSRDLGFAKIWISSNKDIDELVIEIQKNAKEIRKDLASKIELRKIPFLKFYPDHTSERASHIEKVIKKAKSDDSQR